MTADRHMGNSLNEGPFLKDAVISGRPKRDPNLENYPYSIGLRSFCSVCSSGALYTEAEGLNLRFVQTSRSRPQWSSCCRTKSCIIRGTGRNYTGLCRALDCIFSFIQVMSISRNIQEDPSIGCCRGPGDFTIQNPQTPNPGFRI